MKLNKLETHDRLEHFVEDQWSKISEGCNDCLKKNPLALLMQDRSPYIYIFAHPRTHEDGANKRLIWQPRLTKPLAQTNSYLFRAQSKTDNLEVCWLLPPEEMWGQYKKGNVTEHEIVSTSIDLYVNNRKRLEAPDPGDLPDSRIKSIYMEIASIMEPKDPLMPKLSVPSSILLNSSGNPIRRT